MRAPTVSRANDAFFLGRTRNDAQHFFFFHDEEVFAIKFDFSAGVLAEQNGVAFLHREWEQFAFLVGLALPHRDDRALLRFVFCGIGDDEASPRSSHFFFAAHQDAVMQWSKFRCHNCQLLLIQRCDRDMGPCTEANKRIVLRSVGTPVCSLKLHSAGLSRTGTNYPDPKTFFTEYGPGSDTKLIKIDH